MSPRREGRSLWILNQEFDFALQVVRWGCNFCFRLCHLKKQNCCAWWASCCESSWNLLEDLFSSGGIPSSSPQKQKFTPGPANTEGGLGLLFVYPVASGLIQAGRGTVFTGMLLPGVEECSLKGVFLSWICIQPLLNKMQRQYLGCPGWRD